MQRGAIIIGRLAVSFIRLVGSTPQGRLSVILILDDLATVLESSQSRLHLIEFRSGHDIFILRRKNFGDLLLRMLHPIWSGRMRSKGLRQCARFLFLGGFNLFEEV